MPLSTVAAFGWPISQAEDVMRLHADHLEPGRRADPDRGVLDQRRASGL
jgi:hypothetical protein